MHYTSNVICRASAQHEMLEARLKDYYVRVWMWLYGNSYIMMRLWFIVVNLNQETWGCFVAQCEMIGILSVFKTFIFRWVICLSMYVLTYMILTKKNQDIYLFDMKSQSINWKSRSSINKYHYINYWLPVIEFCVKSWHQTPVELAETWVWEVMLDAT